MTIEEMDDYLRQNWRLTKELIKQKIQNLNQSCRLKSPSPMEVSFSLGIPTVMDGIINKSHCPSSWST